MPDTRQPKRYRGTRIGMPARVAPAWREYAGSVDRHAREVHYDVLRREGFSADRARQIAAESSEIQHREVERMQRIGHDGAKVAEQQERLGSGWDIRSILPSAITGGD